MNGSDGVAVESFREILMADRMFRHQSFNNSAGEEARPDLKSRFGRMKRHGSYGDPRISAYSQTEHMASQRLQHDTGFNNYAGKSDSFLGKDELTSCPSKRDSRWLYHDVNQTSNTVPFYPLGEDHGRNDRRSSHQGQIRYPNADPEKEANAEAFQAEQDMEIGYEDTPSPLTFEGLEQKFNDEILRLVKEQNDLEDTENTRHKERLMEINTQYQLQLSSLRTRQAAGRQEFLEKESQARLYQYQNSTTQEYGNNLIVGGSYEYSRASAAAAAGDIGQQYSPISVPEVTRTYGNTASMHYSPMASGEATRGHNHKDPPSQFKQFIERGEYQGSRRNEIITGRVPYPEGRVYNTGPRYH